MSAKYDLYGYKTIVPGSVYEVPKGVLDMEDQASGIVMLTKMDLPRKVDVLEYVYETAQKTIASRSHHAKNDSLPKSVTESLLFILSSPLLNEMTKSGRVMGYISGCLNFLDRLHNRGATEMLLACYAHVPSGLLRRDLSEASVSTFEALIEEKNKTDRRYAIISLLQVALFDHALPNRPDMDVLLENRVRHSDILDMSGDPPYELFVEPLIASLYASIFPQQIVEKVPVDALSPHDFFLAPILKTLIVNDERHSQKREAELTAVEEQPIDPISKYIM